MPPPPDPAALPNNGIPLKTPSVDAAPRPLENSDQRRFGQYHAVGSANLEQLPGSDQGGPHRTERRQSQFARPRGNRRNCTAPAGFAGFRSINAAALLKLGGPFGVRPGAIVGAKSMNWHTCAIFAFLILLASGFFSVDAAVPEPHPLMNTNLTENDDGSTIDILTSANINVFLQVPPEEIYRQSCLWSKIIIAGDDVLQEVRKAILLPTGVTAASFRAIRPGLVQLSSFRYDCFRGLIIDWRVNIRVTSP
jgi:hypothetical protein